MTDHLPECPAAPPNKYGRACICDRLRACICDRLRACICDRLRACEARVREEAGLALVPAISVYGHERYAAALDAARDAVAAVETYLHFPFESPALAMDGEVGVWLVRQHALAAIDALRGDA